MVDLLDGPGDLRQERVAATPRLPTSAATAKAFVGAAKWYLQERYAFKDTFVTLDGLTKVSLFGHSPSSQVLLGNNGQLTLGDPAQIAALQGIPPATGSEDADWVAFYKDIETAVQARGVPFVVVLAPDKASVLPDTVPDWMQTIDIPREARIVGKLSDILDTPPVDLVALFGRHPEANLYHPTDTHWTENAAAIAIDATLAPLDLFPQGLPDIGLGSSIAPGGDLARMIGLQNHVVTDMPTLSLPRQGDCRTPDGVEPPLATLDPLPTRRFTCTNPEAPAGSLLVWSDSFGMAALPRLRQLFRRVDFIWSDTVDPAEIDAVAPDVVMRITVARKLQTQTAADMLVR